MLATPEYNWSVPGGLKNLIDWLSVDLRTPLTDRTALLMCASPSARGGVTGLQHLRTSLEMLDVWIYPQIVAIGRARGAAAQRRARPARPTSSTSLTASTISSARRRPCMRAASCFLALLLSAAPALAQIPPSPIAHASLALDAPQVKAQQPLTAAVTFTIPEHWHIYWQKSRRLGHPDHARMDPAAGHRRRRHRVAGAAAHRQRRDRRQLRLQRPRDAAGAAHPGA
ncbi:MAG: NAD(P)H-dependent oxidoreductase [Alphaproteobacteria bacterium]